MENKKREVFLPRYNFTCPNCMYEQSADTSIAMKMGHNNGHGSCMNCGVFLHLEITPDLSGGMMKAIMWGEHLFNDLVNKSAEDLNNRFKDINFIGLTDAEKETIIEEKLEGYR